MSRGGGRDAAFEKFVRVRSHALMRLAHLLARDAVDSVDDPRIDEFLDTHVPGPQTQEQNAACAGGTRATGDEAQASLEPVDSAVGDPMPVVRSGATSDDCVRFTSADRHTIAAELADAMAVRFVEPGTTGERLVATVGAVRFLSPDTVDVEAGVIGGPLTPVAEPTSWNVARTETGG